MTNYASEEYLITHVALGFDDEPLTDADVVDVDITIYDAEGVVLPSTDDQPMDWNPTPTWSVRKGTKTVTGQGWWQYRWDTASLEDGSYKAKVTLNGVTGGKNFEILKIRLKKDPLA